MIVLNAQLRKDKAPQGVRLLLALEAGEDVLARDSALLSGPVS